MDFVIGLLLFSFTFFIYISYTNNMQKDDKGGLDLVIKDARAIASSLSIGGYPNEWDNNTLVRIGISDDQKLNETKMKNLIELDYNKTKKSFGAVRDFFIFLEDINESIIAFGTKCGVGHPKVNTTKSFRSVAHFNAVDNDLSEELDIIKSALGITIYDGWVDADDMLSNISKYEIVIAEDPQLTTLQAGQLDSYVKEGGILIISSRIIDTDGPIMGVNYFQDSVCDKNATISINDLHLRFKRGDNFTPEECHYVSGEVTNVAHYSDSKPAIAKWNYGKGRIFYFSDFDAADILGYQQVVANSIEGLAADCGNSSSILLSGLNPLKLAKVERFLNLNSKVVKMGLYVWE
jgi:hypothetical protein